MKQYIRKADIILFIVLIVTGLTATVFLAASHTDGGKVIIESGGELYATYSLFEDREIRVPAPDSINSTGSLTARITGSRSGSTDADSTADAGTTPDAHSTTDAGGYNIVLIQDGTVSVIEASCRNQVCVRHSSISKAGESIICLPNRLVVRIEGSDNGKGGGYDSVTS